MYGYVPPSTIRVLGADPGSDTFGLVVADLNTQTWTIQVVFQTTLYANKIENNHQHLRRYGDSYYRMHTIADDVVNMLIHYNVQYVAMESPFFNPKRPNSFEVLTRCRHIVKERIWQVNPMTVIDDIPPWQAKSSLGLKRGQDAKVYIPKCLTELVVAGIITNVDISSMTEHAHDALAMVNDCRVRWMK